MPTCEPEFKSMESVPCNLCGSQEKSAVVTAQVQHYSHERTFKLVRCSNCSLVYVNPRPDKDEIGAYYPRQYQADMCRLIHDGRANPVVRFGLDMIRRRRTPPGKPGGQLLDLGCSHGAYLTAVRDQNWNVQGVELDPEAAEYARRHFGLSVQTGDVEATVTTFPDESFDVVTIWHVLEHLFDPAGVLAQVCRILKPGGLLMLELPNFGCPLASLFGESWFPLEVPRHLYHFTPGTLEAMLEKAGLRLTRIRGVPTPEAIVWSLRSLWNKASEGGDEQSLSLSPVAMSLAFPVSWVLAQFRWSDHMAAVALRPPQVA